jgi:hypothetical protein
MPPASPTTVGHNAHEVGVIDIRRGRSAPINSELSEPRGTPRHRIDHRERPTLRRRSICAIDALGDFASADWKSNEQRFAIGQGPGLVRIGGKQQQTSQPSARMPSESTGGDHRFTLVPTQRALDRTKVTYLGLDLDDQQQTRPGMECEDIDPAARTIAANLDFSGNFPPGSTQSNHDMRGASRVGRIALSVPITKKRVVDRHDEASTHHGKELLGFLKTEVNDTAVLDAGHR